VEELAAKLSGERKKERNRDRDRERGERERVRVRVKVGVALLRLTGKKMMRLMWLGAVVVQFDTCFCIIYPIYHCVCLSVLFSF